MLIAEDETAEFLWIELPVVVKPNDGTRCHEDTDTFGRSAKCTERVFPSGVDFGPVGAKPELVPHSRGQRNHVSGLFAAGDVFQWLLSLFDQIIAHPRLAAFHHLDGLDEIGAWSI